MFICLLQVGAIRVQCSHDDVTGLGKLLLEFKLKYSSVSAIT